MTHEIQDPDFTDQVKKAQYKFKAFSSRCRDVTKRGVCWNLKFRIVVWQLVSISILIDILVGCINLQKGACVTNLLFQVGFVRLVASSCNQTW